ncbi:MAG: HAD-IB family phosphatase [Chloroflexota bacterium]
MRWPHYEHIFFDCDSTLTTVEGIDILADSANKKQEIEALTNAAMDGHLDLEEVYGKRLQTIHPSRAQIQDIRRIYKKNIVEDAQMVIQILQALGHTIYIISGGLAEPVEQFGIYLGVPKERIRAVQVDFDQLSGEWWKTQSTHPAEQYMAFEEGALTISNGKAKIVKELLGEKNGRSLLIGDGTSDLLAGTAVDLFVGFGGVVSREKVRHEAPAFIQTPSISPLLLLAAGPAAVKRVQDPNHLALFKKAFDLTNQGAIQFKNEQLKQKFQKAYQAVYSRTH